MRANQPWNVRSWTGLYRKIPMRDVVLCIVDDVGSSAVTLVGWASASSLIALAMEARVSSRVGGLDPLAWFPSPAIKFVDCAKLSCPSLRRLTTKVAGEK